MEFISRRPSEPLGSHWTFNILAKAMNLGELDHIFGLIILSSGKSSLHLMYVNPLVVAKCSIPDQNVSIPDSRYFHRIGTCNWEVRHFWPELGQIQAVQSVTTKKYEDLKPLDVPVEEVEANQGVIAFKRRRILLC
jgi:hypothetical protein